MTRAGVDWMRRRPRHGWLSRQPRRCSAGRHVLRLSGRDEPTAARFIGAGHRARRRRRAVGDARASPGMPRWRVPQLAVPDLKPARRPRSPSRATARPTPACSRWASPAPTARPRAAVAGAGAATLGEPPPSSAPSASACPQGLRAGTFSDRLHHARRGLLQRRLARLRARGARGRRHGSVVDRPGAGSRRRHAFRRRDLHQPDPRPSRLPRRHGSYERSQGALFEWRRCSTPCVNLDDASGRRLVAHLRAAAGAGDHRLHAARTGRAPAIAARPAGHDLAPAAGIGFAARDRHGAARWSKPSCSAASTSATCSASLGVLLARGVPLTRRRRGARKRCSRSPGRMQRLGGQDAPLVVDRLRAYARRAGKDAARAARRWRTAAAEASCGACSAAAATATAASARRWAPSPRAGRPGRSSPATTRAAKTRSASSPQIVARHASDDARVAGDRRPRGAPSCRAVSTRPRGDVVLLAGKGHEAYQEIKGSKMPFSDADHAALALAARCDEEDAHDARSLRTAARDSRRAASTARRRVRRRVDRQPRSAAAGALFVALRGESFDAPRFLGAGCAGAAARPLVVPTRCRQAGRCRRCVVPDTLAALGAHRQQLAPPVRHSRHRRHRQQRQDHGQGNDRRRSWPQPFGDGRASGHPGQPEQRDRRAADAAAAAARAPRRGDRDGHEPSGRDRPPGRASRSRTSRWSTTPSASTRNSWTAVEAVARAKTARCSQRLPADGVAVLNADDALPPLWHGWRKAAAASTFGLDARCDVTRTLSARGFGSDDRT